MGYVPRIFLTQPISTNLPETICITNQAQYLHTVVRLKPGDALDVVANGQCYQAQWVNGNSKQATIQVFNSYPIVPDDMPTVVLAVSLIPDERWRWMLQKCTELGVNTFLPLLTEYSKIKCTDANHKQQRWQAVVEAAACQSEGLFIPNVLAPVNLTEAIQQYKQDTNILLYERHALRKPLTSLVGGLTSQQSLLIAVGPEGGWSDAEKQVFESHHFQLASVGKRILRTETAAIAAVSTIAACIET